MNSYRFNRGYVPLAYVPSGENGEIELIDVTILVTDASLTIPDDILTVVNSFWDATRPDYPPFLVIAKNFTDKILEQLVGMNAQGLPIFAVKAPAYGDRQKEMLIDIATVTGGVIFPGKPDVEGGRIDAGVLGRAKLVRLSAEETYIDGGAGDEEPVRQRIAQIRHEIETTYSDFDREKLQERLDVLMGK